MKSIYILLLSLLILQCIVEAKHHLSSSRRYKYTKHHHKLYKKHQLKNGQQHRFHRQRFMQKKCAPQPQPEEASEDPEFHTMCPIEYQMRIMLGMLNQVDYDRSANGGFEQTDYVDSVENNRAYKCYAARNVYFTQKMLLYTINFLIMGINENAGEKLGLQPIVELYDKIKKQSYKVLAFGLNLVCHQTEPRMVAVHQEDLQEDYDELNKLKIEMLDAAPQIIHNILKMKFKDAEIGSPSDAKGFYEDIEKILNQQLVNEENAAKWATLFVDLIDTSADLKTVLEPGKPVLMSKRNAALFYDRQSKFLGELRTYLFETLGLVDDEKSSLRKALLVVDAMAASQLQVISWPYYFNSPQQSKACNSEEKELRAKFQYSVDTLWTFKTCGLLSQQVENVRIFENLLEDMEGLKCKEVNYEQYAKKTKTLQTQLCFGEAESCLSALAPIDDPSGAIKSKGGDEKDEASSFIQLQYRAKNRFRHKHRSHQDEDADAAPAESGESEAKDEGFKGLEHFINKIQSCFFRQISALRKHGPISDFYVTRENEANFFMLKMGYQAVRLTEHTPENTLWYCRFCGGGLAVKSLEVMANTDSDKDDAKFNEHPTTEKGVAIVKLKLTEKLHLQVTKVLVDSELNPETSELELLAGVFSDQSGQGYPQDHANLKELPGLDMWFSINKWKVNERVWDNYPSELQLPLTTLEENKSPTCVIVVEQYCVALQKEYAEHAKLVQRWKNLEMWVIDKQTLQQFSASLENQPEVPPSTGPVDIGAADTTVNANPSCKIQFKTVLPPFSYVTLMTGEDKTKFIKSKPTRWQFKLVNPIQNLQTNSEAPTTIPVWLGYRQLYNQPEPTSQQDREPNEESLREINVENKKLANGICIPQGHPCSYIEDSFLPPENFKGTMDELEAMGCAGENSSEGAEENACKELVEKFTDAGTELTAFTEKFSEVLGRDPVEAWATDIGKDLLASAEGGCKFKKTYTFESTCKGKFLYLVRGDDGAIKELCVTDITDPEMQTVLSALPKESVIPIQKTYYAVLVVGNEDFSLPENVYKNFNVANWLRTFPHPLKSEAVKLPMKAVVKFIVSVDLLDFQYIGIKDEYNDEGNCNNYVFGDPTHAQFRNWKRFTPESPKDLFDEDFTIRGYERSLMFAVQASPLSEIQAALGLGDPSGGLWKENLEKNKCKRARIFIPIDWSGHGSEDCSDEEPEEGAAPPPMIKSVMISQTEGIKEICDGSRMAIQDTYYLEVLIMQEADATYKVPSDVELKQAKKHGYILQDPDQAFEFSANGFNTKVRAWVKADTTGFNTRNLICRGTPFKEGIKFKVTYE